MALFLQIVGALCVGLVVIVLLLFLGIRIFGRRALRALQSMTADLQDSAVPARLALAPLKEMEWKDGEKARGLVDALRGVGFRDAGTFVSGNIGVIRFHGLAHEETSVYAVVYEHDKAGVWMDVVTKYENGDGLTHTTAPDGDNVDSMPGHRKVYLRDAAPVELYRRHLADRSPEGILPAPAAGFQQTLEQAYADSMDWRNARGGATEEEIRRTAAKGGKEITDEEVQQVREMQLERAIYGLDEALAERFLKETTMSAAEWEAVEDRLLYIFDLLPPAKVAERFYGAVDPESEEEEPKLPPNVAGLNARAAVARLNEEQPAGRRLEKLGTLAKPVEADVYAAPLLTDGDAT